MIITSHENIQTPSQFIDIFKAIGRCKTDENTPQILDQLQKSFKNLPIERRNLTYMIMTRGMNGQTNKAQNVFINSLESLIDLKKGY